MKRLLAVLGVTAICCTAVNADPQMWLIPIDDVQRVGQDDNAPPAIKGTLESQSAPKIRGMRHIQHSMGTGSSGVTKGSTDAIVQVYRNLTDDPNNILGYFGWGQNEDVGDVILGTAGAGSLESLTFSIYNSGDPNTADALQTLDVEISLYNSPSDWPDPNLAMITYLTTIDFVDPNDPNDIGMLPGYYTEIQLTDLASDPNFVVNPDCEFLAIQKWTAAGWSGASGSTLGVWIVNPPSVGSSDDNFYYLDPNDPNTAGVYSFTDPNVIANFAWAFEENDPTECDAIVYANTDNLQFLGVGPAGESDGDDLYPIGGGLITSYTTSFVHCACTLSGGSIVDVPNAADIVSADMEYEVLRYPDLTLLGSFTQPLGPWAADTYGFIEIPNLESQGIRIVDSAVIIAQRLTNIVWSNPDPATHSWIGQIVTYDSAGCSTGSWVPTPNPIGTSEDGTYSEGQYGWWYGGCPNIANYYARVTVAEVEPLGQNVNRLPDLMPAGTAIYSFNPPIPGLGDPNDVSDDGGWAYPRTIDAEGGEQVPFPTSLTDFRQDPASWTGHAALGWVFRNGDGTATRELLTETPGLGINAANLTQLQFLYETETEIRVEDPNGTELGVQIDIYLGSDGDPNYTGPALQDRQGFFGGTSPIIRKYSPVDETDTTVVPYYEVLTPVFVIDVDPNDYTITQTWTRWDDTTNTAQEGPIGRFNIHRFKQGVFTVTASGPPCLAAADSNCDGAVNFGDIDPFVLAITSGQAAWEALYTCDYVCANDVSGDSSVNFGDIDPFVAAITGG